jgi:hypothetical protein
VSKAESASWRLNAGWKPALDLKLGHHPMAGNVSLKGFRAFQQAGQESH